MCETVLSYIVLKLVTNPSQDVTGLTHSS